MNIIHEMSQVELKNLFLMESRKNIILDGKFTKITNSDEYFSTNGVFIHTPLSFASDKQSNKTLLKFPVNNKQNAKLIIGLSQIEQSILEYYKHLLNSNKQIVLSLSDNMKNGCVKLYRECFLTGSSNYVIKISGVWEDQSRIGLTFKFLDAITI